jgi:hypothetical protein
MELGTFTAQLDVPNMFFTAYIALKQPDRQCTYNCCREKAISIHISVCVCVCVCVFVGIRFTG